MVRSALPRRTSHTMALSSKLPVARRLDLGENDTASTGAVCAASSRSGVGMVVGVVEAEGVVVEEEEGYNVWITVVVSSEAVAT
jgi:hypothetical protein